MVINLRHLFVVISMSVFLSGCVSISQISDMRDTATPTIQIVDTPPMPTTKVFVISGVIVSGTTGYLSPIFSVTGVADKPAESTDYRVVILDTSSEVVGEYKIAPVPTSENSNTSTSKPDILGFRIQIAEIDNVSRVQLLYKTQLLHELKSGSEVPKIQNLSAKLNDDATSGKILHIEWVAKDDDDEKLVYLVQYSPNADDTWYTIGTQLTHTELNVQIENLVESARPLIQVIVSDGIHSGNAILELAFEIHSQPTVQVISPRNEEIVVKNQPIIFLGSGYDPEDGTLQDENLKWHSDVMGIIGYGQILQLDAGLPPGTHVLTLMGTDSDGNKASNSVTIYVE